VLGLSFIEDAMDDNRDVRRGLLLTCLWVLGVTGSVALAFGAVDRVANRVAPPGVARLSGAAVDRALGSTVPSTISTTTRKPTASSAPPSTTRSTASVAPPPGPVGTTTSTVASPPPPAPTTTPHNTVTTSQGGTVWTRCSGADQIVYVAAVPKSEYERTRDIESPGGIEQWFESDSHRSRIKAECSDGVVHAEVEEDSESDE
jgi:hypothetical protein